jgi:hypothetical protein
MFKNNKVGDNQQNEGFSDCLFKEISLKNLKDMHTKSIRDCRDYLALTNHEDNTKLF